MNASPEFSLDPRFNGGSHLISRLSLCQLRLQDDARWPWLVLIPEVADVREIIDLSEADQAALLVDIRTACELVKKLAAESGFEVQKLNVANLGNIVSQLHVHVIARHEGDANWPGPVWGFGAAEPYAATEKERLVAVLGMGSKSK
jgi:diadenosine tetraphosphate (Ap4A) HIT family hydrolase